MFHKALFKHFYNIKKIPLKNEKMKIEYIL